jgi:enediyne biosynthesis protein E3
MLTRLLGIPVEEATFTKRGFQSASPAAKSLLEEAGKAFLHGYHVGLEHQLPDLARKLGEVEQPLQGFAHEGAAMALALLDGLTPWGRTRIRAFLDGPGAPHVYMAHIGVGWALARLPRWRRAVLLSQLDPLLRWLAFDGYGFHEAYFRPQHYVASGEARPLPATYARRAFDQGVGRALWFIYGAEVDQIERKLASFPPALQGDLWSGVGLAATYAGGAETSGLEWLRQAAGRFLPHLAQGAAFAAKARIFARNMTEHTERAARVLCGVSAAAAGAIVDATNAGLVDQGPLPAYEVWRQRVQQRLAELGVRHTG